MVAASYSFEEVVQPPFYELSHETSLADCLAKEAAEVVQAVLVVPEQAVLVQEQLATSELVRLAEQERMHQHYS